MKHTDYYKIPSLWLYSQRNWTPHSTHSLARLINTVRSTHTPKYTWTETGTNKRQQQRYIPSHHGETACSCVGIFNSHPFRSIAKIRCCIPLHPIPTTSHPSGDPITSPYDVTRPYLTYIFLVLLRTSRDGRHTSIKRQMSSKLLGVMAALLFFKNVQQRKEEKNYPWGISRSAYIRIERSWAV